MKTTNEQQEVANDSIDTFTRMSEVALSSIERLTALNLDMARDSLQQGISATKSVSRAQNDCDEQDEDQDQDKSQNRLSGAGIERVTAYVRDAQKIFMETQSEFAELIGKHMSSLGKNARMSFPGMQVFENIAQQTSDMAKANVRNAAEATTKAIEKTSQGRKVA